MKLLLSTLFSCTLAMISLGQTITSVSPSSAQRGTLDLPITISGSGTNFSNATSTVVEISQGTNTLQVLSVGTVAPESVDLNIRVANTDPLGNYTVRVYDQNEGMLSLSSGFTVLLNNNAPSLNMTTPESVAVGQVLPITITTNNANFLQATSSSMQLIQQPSGTIMWPVPGSMTVLNDNAIRANFDFGAPGISEGSVFNAFCSNPIDGSFYDVGAITVTSPMGVSGNVNYPGTFDGVAELYQVGSGNNYSLVESTSVNANSYGFYPVADAEYLVRLVPVGTDDVVATYYTSSIDWQAATVINTSTSTPPYTITPFPSFILDIFGITVNGTLGYGPNGYNKAAVVFAPGVKVFLKDVDDNTFAQTVTDANGAYSFTGVPYGNYEIVIDLPGYEQISTYSFTLNGASTDVTGLDFLIDNDEVFTSAFMGVQKLQKEELTVYPNPTNGELNIDVPAELSTYTVEIYNTVGKRVWHQSVNNDNTPVFTTNVSELANGMYVVKITGESTVSETRLVKNR